MLCLWLVNHLFLLTIIVFVVGTNVLSAIEPHCIEKMNRHTVSVILGIVTIIALLPAILTAKFAKNNYNEMISSGFIRWTSAISLWQSEWKYSIKTFFLSWVFYGLTFLFATLIVRIWFGLK